MSRRVLIMIAVAALFATAVEAKKKYEPFKVPRDQIVGQVKTVALRHLLGMPEDYARSDSTKAVFDSLLTAELQQAGFKVLPSSIFDQVRQESLDSLGGIFDPKTGAEDTAKARQVHLRSLEQLKARYQADALLNPRLLAVTASFASGSAHWDGASQKLWKGTQGVFGILDNRTGKVSALSLLVVITDTNGDPLYVDAGGLSLASRIDGSHFKDLPEDSLFGNPLRNANSVRLALAALTRPEAK
jgi:hypothetical protein